MKELKVDIRKLYTQKAYADEIGKSKSRVNQLIKENGLKTVRINGATLVIKD